MKHLIDQKLAYGYFLEKSSSLIRNLITGTGTSKDRLLENETEFLYMLAFDFPEDLQYLKNNIEKIIYRKPDTIGPFINISSYRNSVYSIRNATASKIIGYFYDLYSEMEYRYS